MSVPCQLAFMLAPDAELMLVLRWCWCRC
jgi:hypothetical protein